MAKISQPKTSIKLPNIAPKQEFPSEHIAHQFNAVHPAKATNEEGYGAERDMYEVQRSQNFMAKNPYGLGSTKG